MESMTDKTDRAAWSALAVMEEGAEGDAANSREDAQGFT